jgi:hypothetical protein
MPLGGRGTAERDEDAPERTQAPAGMGRLP